MGTIGRAIRGVVRFEVGEKVEGDWATTVADMIRRVSPTSAGSTYRVGPRGGVAVWPASEGTGDDPETAEGTDPVDDLDALLDGASDLPPEDAVTFDDGDQPLSILLIDVGQAG